MNEIVLNKKKNGMLMMFVFIAAYLLAIAAIIIGAMHSPLLLVLGIVWICIGWVPFLGLRVIHPQEALVLTLFGKYVGSL